MGRTTVGNKLPEPNALIKEMSVGATKAMAATAVKQFYKLARLLCETDTKSKLLLKDECDQKATDTRLTQAILFSNQFHELPDFLRHQFLQDLVDCPAAGNLVQEYLAGVKGEKRFIAVLKRIKEKAAWLDKMLEADYVKPLVKAIGSHKTVKMFALMPDTDDVPYGDWAENERKTQFPESSIPEAPSSK
jgi:hypothetical protein